MKYIDEFRIPDTVKNLAIRIRDERGRHTFMEVCGTHTMAVSRFGLRGLLAPNVEVLSGPGCPVCVTTQEGIDRAIEIAFKPGVILTTFGDMMKVPGSRGSLSTAQAQKARVKVVYSPLEAVEFALKEQDFDIVFLGVGFETTAPTVAAAILEARKRNLKNFYVLSLLKLVPPALRALATLPDFKVDGLILPGHVSAVIGSKVYSFLVQEFGLPCVIAGFEPSDIMNAILTLIRMGKEGPDVEVEYSRVVRPEGNQRAVSIMKEVFEESDVRWRGLGNIPSSGLSIREEFRDFDAGMWEIELPFVSENKACRCGDVLCGRIRPYECPLFEKVCTPDEPVGPCMVSSEGTCAAYYIYERDFIDS